MGDAAAMRSSLSALFSGGSTAATASNDAAAHLESARKLLADAAAAGDVAAASAWVEFGMVLGFSFSVLSLYSRSLAVGAAWIARCSLSSERR